MGSPRRQQRGQVVKRPGGYLVRIPTGRGADGKRLYYNKTIRGTLKDAEKHLTEKLRELDTDSSVSPSKRTLADFAKDWMEAVQNRVTRKTFEDYRSMLRRYALPELGPRRLDSLRPQDFQKLYNALLARPLAARTVRYVHSVMQNALDDAVRWKLLRANPAKGAILPRRNPPEKRALSPTEARRFLEAARNTRYGMLWELLLVSGIRPREAEALRWSDVKADGIEIHRSPSRLSDGTWEFKEPKTARGRRKVPLPSDTLARLRQHREAQQQCRKDAGDRWTEMDLLFCTSSGIPVDHRRIVERYLRPLVAELGVEGITAYSLRHSCASLLLAAGVNPKALSERLGHANVAFTLDTYRHLLPGMQEIANAALERMLDLSGAEIDEARGKRTSR